ncbi:hypothetical protein ACLOJK_011599 [Asimina triloba]
MSTATLVIQSITQPLSTVQPTPLPKRKGAKFIFSSARFSFSSYAAMLMLLAAAALGGLLSLVFLLVSVGRKGERPANVGSTRRLLPPGPPGLPIIGSLHMLGQLPHLDFHRLSQKYGPIMHIRLGLVPAVVVSSPNAAMLFLKTHDLVFASRPFTQVDFYISYDGRSLASTEYGPYWRNVRKLCTLRLLSNLKIESFRSMRREEVGLFVESLKQSAKAEVEVDVTAMVAALSTSLSCRMVLGKKYMDEDFDKRGFKGVVDELNEIIGAFNIADYIPCLGFLDLQGLRRGVKAIMKVFDAFFEKIIDEHIESKADQNRERDFVDFMLSFMESDENKFQFGRPNIKALMLDMLAASMDSTAAVVEWAFAELLKHPEMMNKAQKELETVVGMDRMVEESDLASLEYVDMVLKESMRLHPVLPLLIPHQSTEDCSVDGYHIPKGSHVIINTWSIGRDPNAWTDPEEFNPERYTGSASGIDVMGHDFQLLPFGAGRRGCPGMQLGYTVATLILAQLVHCFDWQLPNGLRPGDVDMSERHAAVGLSYSNLPEPKLNCMLTGGVWLRKRKWKVPFTANGPKMGSPSMENILRWRQKDFMLSFTECPDNEFQFDHTNIDNAMSPVSRSPSVALHGVSRQ